MKRRKRSTLAGAFRGDDREARLVFGALRQTLWMMEGTLVPSVRFPLRGGSRSVVLGGAGCSKGFHPCSGSVSTTEGVRGVSRRVNSLRTDPLLPCTLTGVSSSTQQESRKTLTRAAPFAGLPGTEGASSVVNRSPFPADDAGCWRAKRGGQGPFSWRKELLRGCARASCCVADIGRRCLAQRSVPRPWVRGT